MNGRPLATVRELMTLLSAYRPNAPVVVSPDHFNKWSLCVYEKNGVLVIVPGLLIREDPPWPQLG